MLNFLASAKPPPSTKLSKVDLKENVVLSKIIQSCSNFYSLCGILCRGLHSELFAKLRNWNSSNESAKQINTDKHSSSKTKNLKISKSNTHSTTHIAVDKHIATLHIAVVIWHFLYSWLSEAGIMVSNVLPVAWIEISYTLLFITQF